MCFLGFWILTLYLTYFYAASRYPSEKRNVVFHQNHKVRAAKSVYEYAYHEKVQVCTCVIDK